MIRPWSVLSIATLLTTLSHTAFAADVLQNSGFSQCGGESDIKVEKLNIKYDKATNQVLYDVAGTNTKSQEVIITLTVTAYGKQVYQKEFDPCDSAQKVAQLCPLPTGQFAASGSQSIPAEYAKQIPAIAFTVPDLDGLAKMEFKAKNGGALVACIESEVSNGKTVTTTAVPVIAAGIAGAALVVSGLSALAGGGPGAAGPSPSFGDVIGWFQSMALNGMLTVDYPPIYRSFTRNFAFSGLLIPIDAVQESIDSFRAKTGGNLTENNVQFLRKQAMFVYDQANSTINKRDLGAFKLFARDEGKIPHSVKGIQAFVEPLIIPDANTFLTALLIFAIVIAAIIVGLLLFKLIVEAFAMCGALSKGLEGFRKRYWWTITKTITNLILLLYGVWTLYCVYQFTRGDSWAAKVLAGVTLGIFTAILVFFIWRIWSLARNGNASNLYENKETWVHYSIFYEFYKKQYWWVFIPTIIYLAARGIIIAVGDGRGMVQVGGQIGVELLMLLLLIILRPYSHKSGNWIAISIAIVRLLSISCILVFVEHLAISDTPKAVAGVVLVVIQSVLTAVLAILIIVNGILHCCRANPHRKARKEAEKRKTQHMRLLNTSHDAYDLEATKNRGLSSEYNVSEQPAQNAPLLHPVYHSDHFRDGTQYADTGYRTQYGDNSYRTQYGDNGYHTNRGYHRISGQ